MADTALENAMRSRDELAAKVNKAQQQIDDWRREIAEAEAFINSWHRWAGTESPIPAASQRASVLEPNPAEAGLAHAEDAENRPQEEGRKRPMGNSKKEDVAAEVRKIIEERGRVVPRKELLPELIRRGYTIEGTDPDMVLSTMLWRAGNAAGVVRVGRAGYWLIEKDWPEANYYPQVTELTEAIGDGGLDVTQEAFGGIISAMDRAIETVIADIQPDRLIAINTEIEMEIGLPQDLDRRLNENVEDVLGRELSDRERLVLTNRALAAVKHQVTGA